MRDLENQAANVVAIHSSGALPREDGMAAACALRALWAAPPRRAPTRGPAAARAATGAHASPSQRGDRDGATNKNRRRHGPHAPDVNLHWRAKNLERSGDRLGARGKATAASFAGRPSGRIVTGRGSAARRGEPTRGGHW